MTEAELLLAKRFTRVGNDGVHFTWSTPSWTRRGIEHEITLEWDGGKIECSCEHATYRKRFAWLMSDDLSYACKHIRIVKLMLDSYLRNEAAKELLKNRGTK